MTRIDLSCFSVFQHLVGIGSTISSEDALSYLWSELLASTIHGIHRITRSLAECHTATYESYHRLLECWTHQSSLFDDIDELTKIIIICNPSAAGPPMNINPEVLRVQRSIGCIELCLIQSSVFSLIVARRLLLSELLMNMDILDSEWFVNEVGVRTTSVVQRLLRLVDTLIVSPVYAPRPISRPELTQDDRCRRAPLRRCSMCLTCSPKP